MFARVTIVSQLITLLTLGQNHTGVLAGNQNLTGFYWGGRCAATTGEGEENARDTYEWRHQVDEEGTLLDTAGVSATHHERLPHDGYSFRASTFNKQ